MRIGQLVGFAEKRFSFDLVSRKKPAPEPVETEAVEPFESLILRRMPAEGETAGDGAELPAPVEMDKAQPDMDAPEAPASAIASPLPAQTQAPVTAAQPQAGVVSPESVMAALNRVNTARVERNETVSAPVAITPAPAVAAPVTQVTPPVPPAAPSAEAVMAALTRVNTAPVVRAEPMKAAEVVAPATPAPAAAPVAAEPMREAARPMPAAPTEPEVSETPRRASSRARTTFLGFDRSGARTEDVFSKETAARANPNRSEFPFGWVVVIDGPGRGTSFAIQDGVSQIGRGDDQMVQLDFGDMGISRSNHAAIAFDDEAQQFFLGHGGKANIVRLNGRPVLSTEPLNHGDKIRIGETTLRFVAFCGEEFVWNKV